MKPKLLQLFNIRIYVVPPINYIRLYWKPELDDKVAIRNQFSTTSILISRTESVEYQIEGSQTFTLVIIWERVYPLIYRDREYSCSKNLMINIGLGTFGLPGLDLDFQRHYNLNPCRCHFTTVSGLTIKRLNFQSVHNWESRDQKKRSWFRSLMRVILRCWTTSCCRRARFSRRSLLRFARVNLKIQKISSKPSFNLEFS